MTGDYGFKLDHIIIGSHCLHVLLSMLFNLMVVHGHTPTDLLKFTIVSIPKYNKSDMQFVYNEGHSITLCALVWKLLVII